MKRQIFSEQQMVLSLRLKNENNHDTKPLCMWRQKQYLDKIALSRACLYIEKTYNAKIFQNLIYDDVSIKSTMT